MKPVILVVDDNAMFRKTLLKWLAAFFPECVIMEAASGEECTEIVEQVEPDIALMDVYMSGMGGIEATRALREKGKKTKVVIMTSAEKGSHWGQAASAGAVAFVVKDRLWLELPGVLARLLNEAYPSSGCNRR
jgi:CheY-like chemotaxis protein